MNEAIKYINEFIQAGKEAGEIEAGQVSDGYHTFDELYEFRKMYNAALFNTWANVDHSVLTDEASIDDLLRDDVKPAFDVHKSQRHHDGELCFGGGWFVVVAMLPSGQITNHYPMSDWDLFHIPEADKAKYPFDGHTGKDVLQRLRDL